MLYDYASKLSVKLYEYEEYLVKGIFRVESYSIIMRTPDGTDYNMKGYLYEDSDRIYLDESDVDDAISALCGKGQIRFYLQSDEQRATSYLFTIDASNFAVEYNSKMND